jgi:isopentenyl phosphate kinase
MSSNNIFQLSSKEKHAQVCGLTVHLTVLKLGGSVITNKEKELTPRLTTIERLAKEISRANISPLILVHGGGSFGHPLAKRYRIKEGYNRKASQLIGFAKTHQAMRALNKLVVDALVKEKIPAVAVSPSSFIMTKAERIHSFSDEPLTTLLQLGLVPVLFGDAVFDFDKGFTILSGDQLIAHIALRFKAERIIVGADVDGLCTHDPKTRKEARLLTSVNLEELPTILRQIEETKTNDVTGGMPSKVKEIVPAVENGISVFLVNAAKPNRLYKALKNEQVKGTRIYKG